MNKYQFYISFEKENTAGSKAIQDCNYIFSSAGYQDLNIHDAVSTNKKYLFSLLKAVVKLLLTIKSKSIIAVQYPLLSGNRQFKFVLKALKLKKVKSYCIIHDLDSLRYAQSDAVIISREVALLNCYDLLIVHNDKMLAWLTEKGVVRPMISLEVFDYIHLKNGSSIKKQASKTRSIVFAGNLSKSRFIYSLHNINWLFNIYGPYFDDNLKINNPNLTWKGSYPPNEIAEQLDGTFGLIWDGEFVDRLDDKLGNYLKYNNPHKVSLYLAAGIPIIAPKNSAVGDFVQNNQIGFLVSSLNDLNDFNITPELYQLYQDNVRGLSQKIKSGFYTSKAVTEAERVLIS